MKLFSQAIFQCHIPLCLIHEVGVSHWHHLSSSSQATGLPWPLSSSTRETDASEEHLSIRSLWKLGCVSIFNQPNETHESDTVASVQAWEHTGDGCMHACMLGKQCTLTVSHYCAITSVYLWHSGYPNKDFHMPVTDVFPVWTLLKTQLWANVGKQVS